MKRKICWIIAIITMVFATSCRHNEKLDSIKDQELMRAMKSAQNQSDKDIDIDALENCIAIYNKKGEKGKICWCNTLLGYKSYAKRDYDKSIIYLKRAESNLQYCDSISSFVYSMIVSNTMTTDTTLALHYARKALEKDLEYNCTRKLPYTYMNMSLLTKGDSARYYLAKSLEYFDNRGDKIAKCKYAWWHKDELEPDTIIAYAKPYYDSIKYTGHARILAEAYLRKGDANSAQPYIEHIGRNKKFKTDYHFYNSRRLALLGEHEKANESWEMAYDLLLEESKFMFSQRLGAINAEYDLLNAELENKKEKLRIRGAYNVVLLIVIVILVATYTIKERHRKNAEKLKLDVEELEQDVCELEENVSNLELNVSHLEGNVNNLEQEVSNLERDIQKRKERFSNLFEEYRKVYKAHRDTIFADALSNLSEMHKAYPELKKTDLAMIWLTFMDCSRDSICEVINISQTYYYQRKSIIHRVLGIPVRDGESWHKSLEKIVRGYIRIEE
jgi:hypothetical protein